jgi:hypothetical protein
MRTLLLILLGASQHAAPQALPTGLDAEIKRIVRESQDYEYFTIYTNPATFDKAKLGKYWAPERLGGKEVSRIEAGVNRLIAKGWHYGRESRTDLFEFQSVSLVSPGDVAIVATKEIWYLPLYDQDGNRVKDRQPRVGPFQIQYTLKKIGSNWLITESSTPRATK